MDEREGDQGHKPARLQREFLQFQRRREALRKLAAPPNVKHLLRVLDDHADKGSVCWLKLATLSREMQVSESTVKRAVADSKALKFLDVARRTKLTRANKYTIRWPEIWSAVYGEPGEEAGGSEAAELRGQLGLSTSGFTGHSEVNLASQPAKLRGQLGLSISSSEVNLASRIIRIEASKEEEVVYKLPPPPEAASAGATAAREWLALEMDIAAFPLGDSARSVKAARDHGCDAGFVRELLAWAVANRSAWDNPSGALRFRLLNAWPRQSVSEHWPAPRKGKQTEADRQREAADWLAASAAEEERIRLAAERQNQARAVHRQRELDFGPELDAVPQAAALEFIGGVIGKGAAFQIARWRRDGSKWPPSGWMRDFLLCRLAERVPVRFAGQANAEASP
jgi:hypothetical protein